LGALPTASSPARGPPIGQRNDHQHHRNRHSRDRHLTNTAWVTSTTIKRREQWANHPGERSRLADQTITLNVTWIAYGDPDFVITAMASSGCL
jgi:hypothetical protein